MIRCCICSIYVEPIVTLPHCPQAGASCVHLWPLLFNFVSLQQQPLKFFDFYSLSLSLSLAPPLLPSLSFFPSPSLPFPISLSQFPSVSADLDPLSQLLPTLRGPAGAKQGSEEKGDPQALSSHSHQTQPQPRLQSPPQPRLQSPSQPQPQLQSPTQVQPQNPLQSPLQSPTHLQPQNQLQSPTLLQPSEANVPRAMSVKREPPGTPSQGTAGIRGVKGEGSP